MSTKTEFVEALLGCTDRVYVANQSSKTPEYPLLLYEQTQDKPVAYADNRPTAQQVAFWVYFYDRKSVAGLEMEVDAVLAALGYSGRLIREQTEGEMIGKIKEYATIRGLMDG